MKAALVAVLFFTTFAFAQAPSPLAAAEAACGPAEAQFNAQTANNQPPASPQQPEAGKSLVYVLEVFDKAANQVSKPTLRVGLDGKWVGADKDDSYISFSVDPGEHHLCTRWQSRWKRFSDKAAFASLTADPGKVYYFRARIIEGEGSNFALDFAPVNEDEGKYLVASSAPSISHPKK
ncbi:MAG: hypothetical protein ABSG72_19570 [Candidatus Sulfotelmatobacter sp.]|jgi:hypothetical protein